MIIRAADLFDKEVICISDGSRIGYIGEFEFDTDSGHIETVIIPGIKRFFGLFGKTDDILIPFSCIEVFGDEVILVNYNSEGKTKNKSLKQMIHKNQPYLTKQAH